MELRQLGDSDLRVSRVGLGCNNFGGRVDVERTRAVIDAALTEGVTFLDTADVYGGQGRSEQFIGEILRGRRDQAVIATKFGNDMGDVNGAVRDDARGSRDYVRKAVETSLQRLETDYIDLYYYHRPDNVTPVEETLAALDELVSEGKVRAIGCSNFSTEQLTAAESHARSTGKTHFVALQNQYSLLERSPERELIPLCREYDVGFVPYFPLASGLLTGKYRRGEPPPAGTRLEARPASLTDENFDRVERYEQFAVDHGHSILELAIAALASQPGIPSVIAGATSPEQLKANAAGGAWQLTEAELKELAAL
jgi:aryl-alcohol dehydrogenase-like predicted oxidoreductase